PLGLLNALVWPLLIRVALPITVLTIGLGALLFNGATVFVAAVVVPGFSVDSIWSGIALAIWLTLVNTAATTVLAIDDDDFYYRSVVRRLAGPKGAINSKVPGVVFFQLDGVAYEVLVHAIRNGDAVTIAHWIRTGSHRLLQWETDWSSQTGASQAGLLHGSNADMPAFRWWEKERAAPMVSNHPRDAMEIERRHSNGRGLLAFDGASRANVLSGDAPQSSLTMSTVLQRDRPGQVGEAYYAYFANPYNLIRTVLLAMLEIATELWNAAEDRRRDFVPRVHRGFVYALVRAWTCVVQRDLQIETVIGDIYAGRPVVYTDLLAYDAVAHHSGTERHDTLRVLGRMDRQVAPAAARRRRQNGAEAEPPEVVVMASGCLGLIYFARRPGRLTLEEIDTAYPRLIPALRAHQGIGFVLVRSSRHGAVIIGNAGMHYL